MSALLRDVDHVDELWVPVLRADGHAGCRGVVRAEAAPEGGVVHDQLVAVQHAVTRVVLRNSSKIPRSEPPARWI